MYKMEIKPEDSETSSEYEFLFDVEEKDYNEIMSRLTGEIGDSDELQSKPECPECHKLFSRNSTMKKHLLLHDPNYVRPDKSSVCQICGKVIKGSLTTHLKVHSDERPFSCEFCSKTFRRKEKLKKHLESHTSHKVIKAYKSTKTFTCELCLKVYRTKDKLINHQFIHSNECPFECNFCGKSYTNKSTFHDHLAKHSKEKLHVCSVCNSGFYVELDFIKHQSTHAKPFSCQLCHKNFSHKRSLIRHQKSCGFV